MKSLNRSEYFFNRELSWLKFNQRVLEEAEDESHPLLERLKFLSIFSSNLDEFYMIRVAGLKDQVHANIVEESVDGLTPLEQIIKIAEQVHPMVELQSKLLTKDVLPKLRINGVEIKPYDKLTPKQKEFILQKFKQDIFPLLTPMALDPTHPTPNLKNLRVNLLVNLRKLYETQDKKLAIIQLPQVLPRFYELETEFEGKHEFIVLEEIVKHNLELIFPNMKITDVWEFRITRNADLDISEAEADDLLKLIEKELRKRRLGTVVRLEVHKKMDETSREFLKETMKLEEHDIYDVNSMLDISSFMEFLALDLPRLKDKPFTPALSNHIVSAENIFDAICQKDILLLHPYDSFNHVVELIETAANDPEVLAIKQTLYRTSGNSPIVRALKQAVENGKQVTALIELKARFDEKNNIVWAKELERAGVNVIYGVMGLKTHCKVAMIIRKEKKGLRYYLHMGTGNYNDKTAKIYTDYSFMTCRNDYGHDVSEMFNMLTGYSQQKEWRKILVAPIYMRNQFESLIEEYIKLHSEKSPSSIQIIMNSLVDPGMIKELYKASMRGVKIELIIRGICCLRPGIDGVSENITVRSIVGRFLEHPRVFVFKNKKQRKIYMGSADWMQRNLNRRVELVFPIEDSDLQEQVVQNIEIMLKDNVKARFLQSDGEYVRKIIRKNVQILNSHEEFLRLTKEKQQDVNTIFNKKHQIK